MSDLSWLAPTIISLGVVGKQYWEAHLAAQDRAEAQKRRDATDAKVEAVGAVATEVKDISVETGHKVDGHAEKLELQSNLLRQTNAALKTEVVRLNEPGAEPSNEHDGPVSTDAAGQVNVAGEDRRK